VPPTASCTTARTVKSSSPAPSATSPLEPRPRRTRFSSTTKPGNYSTPNPPGESASLPKPSSGLISPKSVHGRVSTAGASVLSNPPPAARPTGPATEVEHGPRNGQQVALTFHGQGDPAIATSVLAALTAGRAKVTVMAVGTWLDAHPSMAASITGGGHELGNHTWSHPELASLSEQGIRAEIGRCRDTLIRLSGSPGGYFRSPVRSTPPPSSVPSPPSSGTRCACPMTSTPSTGQIPDQPRSAAPSWGQPQDRS